ncbi:arginine-ornithine antiporter [Secundilactobacillus oryzae]|nr:arginine-ornithine antiporter [Secundilactobacillus oryzae]
MDKQSAHPINGITLIALVITSSIGSGIFALSSDLANAASPGPAMIAWLVVGFGILMLALCLNNLLNKRPDLDGIFSYGKEGFGTFVGFISGWGYWMSAWLGNVAFATVFMSTLGYFFPTFKSGNNIPSIIVASLVVWALTFLVNRGIESAALMNTVITVCKLIPIFIFIIVALILFKGNTFTSQFWTNMQGQMSTGNLLNQIKNCLMVMMWVFVGIEGATIMSARAKSRSIAGRATIVGVIGLLVIYILASILPYGYLSREALATMKEPAMVYIFENMVGSWGGTFISIGLLISILGAWLSWTMLPAETLQSMSEQNLLPKFFGKKNRFGAPTTALVLTGVIVQLFLISLLFTNQAYIFAYSLCTASIVICYIFVAAYQVKYSWQNLAVKGNKWQLVIGLFALVFQIGAIILAGIQYLLICLIIYIPGIVFYMFARKNAVNRFLTKREWSATAVICAAAVATIFLLSNGIIHI